MWRYATSTAWKDGKLAVVRADGKPDMEVATPPDFGGQDGVWTPEDLLSASVGSCLMMSALYFVQRKKLNLRSFAVESDARMEKTKAGLAITRVEVKVKASVAAEPDREGMVEVIELAEDTCPVSVLLKCPVDVELQCDVEGS